MSIQQVSIIVPLYNEAGNVEKLAQEIMQVMSTLNVQYEILLINDGSADATWAAVKQLCTDYSQIKGFDLAGNYGQSLALRAGFEHAQGDVIVAMDGDCQHDPKYIPTFLAAIEEGYDLVGGSKEKRLDNPLKNLAADLAHRLIATLSGVEMKYFGATFKVYRRYLLENINLLTDSHRFLGALVVRKGIRYKEFPIEIRERFAGKSHYRFSKAISVIIDLIFIKFMISYMRKPFRLFGMSGAIIFIIGLFLTLGMSLGSLFLGWYIKEEMLAEFLLSVFAMILGLLLVCFGLIAEIGIYNYYLHQRPYTIRAAANYPYSVAPTSKKANLQ